MKIFWNLKFTVIGISLCLTHFDTIAQDLKTMFYCSGSGDIEDVWLLGTKGFIGWDIRDNNNYLVLFSKERLPQDTLLVGDNTYQFLLTVIVENDSTIHFNTLNKYVSCSIKNNRFKVERTVARTEFEKEYFGCTYFYMFGQVKIWVGCGSIQAGEVVANYQTRDHKGPVFNIKLTKQDVRKVYKGSPKLDAEIMYRPSHQEVYFSLEKAGKFVVFKPNTQQRAMYAFPVADRGKESYRLFYDYVQDKLYAVRYAKKEAARLYAITTDYQLIPLGEYNRQINGVVAGGIHVVQQEKNGDVCHYLIPIHQENSLPMLILENVDINHEK